MGQKQNITDMPIAKLEIDPDVLQRVEGHKDALDDYEEARRIGREFPPAVAFDDGQKVWLAAGVHRLTVELKLGNETLRTDVRKGTKSDAIWYACAENLSHGVRPTKDERQRAAENAFRDPELGQKSTAAIAAQCGISHATATKIRKRLFPGAEEGQPPPRRVTGKSHGKSVEYDMQPPKVTQHEEDTPDSQSNGHKPSEKTPKDQHGDPIPKWLEAVDSDSRTAVDGLLTQLSKLGKALQEVSALPSGAGSKIVVEDAADYIKELRRVISGGRFHVVCPDCADQPSKPRKKCEVCHGDGWLSKDEYYQYQSG